MKDRPTESDSSESRRLRTSSALQGFLRAASSAVFAFSGLAALVGFHSRKLTAYEQLEALGPETVRAIQDLKEGRRRRSSRLWAAMMLAPEIDICRSVLQGLPVRAGGLDGEVLRRALRGAALPASDSYLTVTAEMLDAVAEAGAF